MSPFDDPWQLLCSLHSVDLLKHVVIYQYCQPHGLQIGGTSMGFSVMLSLRTFNWGKETKCRCCWCPFIGKDQGSIKTMAKARWVQTCIPQDPYYGYDVKRHLLAFSHMICYCLKVWTKANSFSFSDVSIVERNN